MCIRDRSVLSLLVFKHKKFRAWLNGTPTILIANGNINHTAMQKLMISFSAVSYTHLFRLVHSFAVYYVRFSAKYTSYSATSWHIYYKNSFEGEILYEGHFYKAQRFKKSHLDSCLCGSSSDCFKAYGSNMNF